MMNLVTNGTSAPKLAKVSENCGKTYMPMMVMIIATKKLQARPATSQPLPVGGAAEFGEVFIRSVSA